MIRYLFKVVLYKFITISRSDISLLSNQLKPEDRVQCEHVGIGRAEYPTNNNYAKCLFPVLSP